MKIVFDTTSLQDLRAAVLIPAQIRPAPKGVTLTVVSMPANGGRHERVFALEPVTDPTDLSRLPTHDAGKTRLMAYRLAPRDSAQLDVFRQEMQQIAKQNGRKNKGSISISADKICHTDSLPQGPLHMTSYLKTSETGDYVVLTKDVDLRDMAARHKIDLGTAIPPCPTQQASSRPGAP
ncbi:MAG: hypothetical protein ACRC56_13095 [Bosea sp. (in: a-proteobacteria)]